MMGGGGHLWYIPYQTVSDCIGIKLIPVSVSEWQINNTFNDTFHDNINQHRAILIQK